MKKQLTEEHKRNIGLGNSGKKRTEEEKKKLSEIHKSLFKNGFTHPMLGKHHSEESKNKISESWKELYKNGYINPKGMKSKKHSEETKINLSNNHKSKQEGFIHHFKGKHLTEEHKNKTSLSLKGKMTKNIELFIKKSEKTRFKKGNKPWSYIDGRSKTKGTNRYGDDWDKIRLLIYIRDKFTCQNCGIKGIRLDVHHKNPFFYSFDNSLNNLVTLCKSCHTKEEMRIRKNLKQQEIISW